MLPGPRSRRGRLKAVIGLGATLCVGASLRAAAPTHGELCAQLVHAEQDFCAGDGPGRTGGLPGLT